MKLNQLIAVLKTVKSNSAKAKTAVYKNVQVAALFKGLSRTYQPREEDGYVYPSENQPLQKTADDAIAEFREACTELFNLSATQDSANTTAKASVVVDGVTILSDVPVTTLLFLEKQLIDIKTFVGSLPTLDSDQEWRFDENRGCYVTEPKQTAKTKKVSKPVVLYEATKEHPAQVKEVSEDVVEGTWSLVNFSGALPVSRVKEIESRIDKLIKAVLTAREEANESEVRVQRIADPVFQHIFS